LKKRLRAGAAQNRILPPESGLKAPPRKKVPRQNKSAYLYSIPRTLWISAICQIYVAFDFLLTASEAPLGYFVFRRSSKSRISI
jgi:hypothetical protein